MHILYKEEDNGYVGMFFQPQLQKPELIIEFKKWSLKDSRRYKKIWEVIKKNLKEAGITEVYSFLILFFSLFSAASVSSDYTIYEDAEAELEEELEEEQEEVEKKREQVSEAAQDLNLQANEHYIVQMP